MFAKFTEGAIKVIIIIFIGVVKVNLTSNIICFKKICVFQKNFSLSQSDQPNFDYPQMNNRGFQSSI